MPTSAKAPEPILVSVEDAAQMLSICRASLYKLLGSGEIRSVKHGRRTLVPVQSLREWAAGLPGMSPTLAS